jgi:hypothetical protein
MSDADLHRVIAAFAVTTSLPAISFDLHFLGMQMCHTAALEEMDWRIQVKKLIGDDDAHTTKR